jgi:formylglycine-generating enzyme required for sulfatase activity
MLEDPEFKQRFARENRALVKLQHPHIVSILFVGEEEGLPYAVMQFLPGGDLKVRRKKAMGACVWIPAEMDLPTWLPGIARALDFIHGEGFIHRDVKPANILFDGHGNVFLSDFGVAKVVSDKQTRPGAALTGTGMVLGTPEYMAPELIMGDGFDGRVDQYALAISVYEVLCGRTPFQGTKSETILVKQVTEAIPPLTTMKPDLSRALSDSVAKALSKDPSQRYSHCAEFADAVLQAASLKQPGRATSPSPLSPISDEGAAKPSRARDTAGMGQVRTEVHAALASQSVVANTAGAGSPLRSHWGSLLALWLGLAVVFLGFVTALAVMNSAKTASPDNDGELSEEEKILAVPVAEHREDRDFINSLGMKMLCIGPGRFVGASANSSDGTKWESRTGPVWMAECEVTVAEYFAFLNDQAEKAGHLPEWLRADESVFVDGEHSPYHHGQDPIYQNGMPITGITPAQAVKFCEWLSRHPEEGLQYRLPNREEWICAYRAGTESAYYWGDSFRPGQCNTSAGGIQNARLALTRSHAPNGWGFYNMAGNVSEFLLDGKTAAGGNWKSTQPNQHAAAEILPVTNELWLYGFRVAAIPQRAEGGSGE